jgi:hypothetical protein
MTNLGDRRIDSNGYTIIEQAFAGNANHYGSDKQRKQKSLYGY